MKGFYQAPGQGDRKGPRIRGMMKRLIWGKMKGPYQTTIRPFCLRRWYASLDRPFLIGCLGREEWQVCLRH